MALRNSKTGSLPVSEIYSFMTEHFPYFKVSQFMFSPSPAGINPLKKCGISVTSYVVSSLLNGLFFNGHKTDIRLLKIVKALISPET